jgi:hypothetical protein
MTTTLISFPTEKRGFLRAVSYGVSGVVIYDDKVNERQAIWNESDMESAIKAMDILNEFFGSASRDVQALPENIRRAALKAALARGLG